MRALRYHGRHDLRLEDVERPKCGEGQVRIRPVYCGICGSDLHEYVGGPVFCPTTPHPLTGDTIPVIMGHEFSGIIEEVGKGVSKFKVGDRVCVEPILWDGSCTACKANSHNLCSKGGFLGLSGFGGGFAESVVVRYESVYKLPDSVSLQLGALVEPLAVAWHTVKISPLKKGDTVVVLGGGPIGLAMLLCLKAHGAENVIVSEVAQRRKEFAKEFGADHVIDPSKEDFITRCRELSGGDGVDIIFDCAGVQAAVGPAVEALRFQGTLVNVAIWEGGATIMPTRFVVGEKKYMGALTYIRGEFDEVIQAMADGRIRPDKMITAKVRLEEIIEKGFDVLVKDKSSHVKIMVQAGEEA